MSINDMFEDKTTHLHPFDSPEKTVTTMVIRETKPLGVMGGMGNALKNLASGGLIGGALAGAVGAVIGAFNGIGGADAFLEELETTGKINIGGGTLFSPDAGANIGLSGDGLREALETNPDLTSAGIKAADTAMQSATTGAIGGAATGFIKGGWVDYIVKEREIAQNGEQVGDKSYCR